MIAESMNYRRLLGDHTACLSELYQYFCVTDEMSVHAFVFNDAYYVDDNNDTNEHTFERRNFCTNVVL